MIAPAILDACVLYPPSLRDLLMRLAMAGAYEPRWTEKIHDEWIRNVLADNPNVTPAQLDRTRRLMNQAVPNCVVSGYEAHIPVLSLPDINDRHVLAAAIEAQAALIVTFNLSDFPDAVLRRYGVRAVHPDRFLSGLFDEDLGLFLQAVQAHRASLHHPPKDAAGYVQTLRINRLKELALRLEADLSHI
jgi:predicted nucleic acid-binding protein